MGGINSLSGLNKVNVDFRPAIEPNAPKTTGANRPQPEPAVLPDDAQPPAEAGARSVVRQLDVLLLNAAGKSVAADAATNVKTVGQSLVDKGVLSRKEASRLESLAEDAAAKLKASNEIECVRDYNERICPSFFKREFFHNMFTKPKQSA